MNTNGAWEESQLQQDLLNIITKKNMRIWTVTKTCAYRWVRRETIPIYKRSKSQILRESFSGVCRNPGYGHNGNIINFHLTLFNHWHDIRRTVYRGRGPYFCLSPCCTYEMFGNGASRCSLGNHYTILGHNVHRMFTLIFSLHPLKSVTSVLQHFTWYNRKWSVLQCLQRSYSEEEELVCNKSFSSDAAIWSFSCTFCHFRQFRSNYNTPLSAIFSSRLQD